VALVTVEDIETAMGTTFSETETGTAEFYINGLCAYIETKTGVSFATKTGQVKRFRADPYGIIKLNPGPVNAVSLIHDVYTNTDLTSDCWLWNGLDEIRYLYGFQIVDITYDYGIAVPADDVKMAATTAVMRGILSPQDGLKSKQVGDVIHQYAGMLPLSEEEMDVLLGYTNSEWTVKLDGGYYPHTAYSYFPFAVNRSDFYEGSQWY
jgi:hypothetical protein